MGQTAYLEDAAILIRGRASGPGAADPWPVGSALLALLTVAATAAASPPAPVEQPAHLIAHVRSGNVVTLRSHPFGPVVARVGALTRFGSERALGVVSTERGRWLGVTEPGVAGNRVVW